MPRFTSKSPIQTFLIYALLAVAYFVVTDGVFGPYLSSGPWYEVVHIIADWTFVGVTIIVMYRLFGRLALQREQLQSLWRIAIEADLDRDAQVLAMLSEGARALEMDAGSIGHLDGDFYVFDIQDRRLNLDRKWPVGETLASRAAVTGRTIKSEDVLRDPLLCDHPSTSRMQLRAFVSTPFNVKTQQYSLTFRSRRPRMRPFSLEDIEYVELIANFFGRLFLQREQEAEIARLAFLDSLTGLSNRASFHDHLQRQLARAAREKGRFCLFFIDLDGFKVVNDTFGHSAGDNVLAEVGQRLLRAVRTEDIAGRLGGDEFGILAATITEPPEAIALAQRLRSRLSEPFVIGDHAFSVTGSIGIAFYPQDGTSIETLVEHADAAAYFSKSTGGGHFTFYSPQLQTQFGKAHGLTPVT